MRPMARVSTAQKAAEVGGGGWAAVHEWSRVGREATHLLSEGTVLQQNLLPHLARSSGKTVQGELPCPHLCFK